MSNSAGEQWKQSFLRRIAVQRPNHSEALDRIAGVIKQQLKQWQVPFQSHPFILRPFKHLLAGTVLWGLSLLFLVTLLFDLFWIALIIAFAIPVLLILEFEVPLFLVSRLVERQGENISVTFPADHATSELILCAHYDAKTDFFDHVQREKLYQLLIPMFFLGGLLPVVMLLQDRIPSLFISYVTWGSYGLAGVYVVFWGLIALAFGGYIFIGAEKQSKGVIDNATAVTALMAVIADIDQAAIRSGAVKLTILLTAGEEVSMQGALAFVKERRKNCDSPSELPSFCLNLELIGQPGKLLVWKRYGAFFRFIEGDKGLIRQLEKAVEEVTGDPLLVLDKSADDALYLQKAGIRTITMAHSGGDVFGEKGFHSIHDNFERLSPDNLNQAIAVIQRLISDFASASGPIFGK